MTKVLPITLLIAITMSVTLTVAAASSGALNFLGIGPNDKNIPLINGTIINYDNKTYGILVVPKNGTIPPPVVNNTPPVNDTIPPVPVANKPPTVNVTTPVNCPVNTDCVLTAQIDDPDGNITQAIWNIESEQQVDFTSSIDYATTPDTYTATFKPAVNETYVFSIEAQDNNGSSVLKSITVNPKVAPLPSHCEPDEHLVDNICIPNTPEPTPTPTPTPTPVPEPTATNMKVILVGDIEDSTAGNAVFNQIKVQNPTNVLVLGDLGYESNLAWFKSTYGTFGNKVNCVLGNHDAANEDGSSSIEKEALQYCANSYYIKKNHVLFLAFNTNGDLTKQATDAGKLLTNTDFMNGVKSVHIVSHKPCAVPPNAHHPVEIKTFCDAVKAKIPSTIKVYYDQAHNHIYSRSVDGTYKQIGTGGKSHYTCGISADFPICLNQYYGFGEYIIKPDGTTTFEFKDYNGVVKDRFP